MNLACSSVSRFELPGIGHEHYSVLALHVVLGVHELLVESLLADSVPHLDLDRHLVTVKVVNLFYI